MHTVRIRCKGNPYGMLCMRACCLVADAAAGPEEHVGERRHGREGLHAEVLDAPPTHEIAECALLGVGLGGGGGGVWWLGLRLGLRWW